MLRIKFYLVASEGIVLQRQDILLQKISEESTLRNDIYLQLIWDNLLFIFDASLSILNSDKCPNLWEAVGLVTLVRAQAVVRRDNEANEVITCLIEHLLIHFMIQHVNVRWIDLKLRMTMIPAEQALILRFDLFCYDSR